MPGIRYKGQVYSGAASVGNADDVNYDNTSSGLSANNVQDAVDEVVEILDESKTVTTGTITNLITGGTMYQYACYKIGNIVHVGARVYNISQPAYGDFFNIPEGFRPKYKLNASGYMYIGSTATPCVCEIGTDGNVNFLISSSQTTTQVYFSATYAI